MAAVWVFALLGLGMLIAGIIHRCILMGRPPVGNLYDTLPFITAGGMIVLFLLEAKTRRRIALGAGLAIGLLGMFLTPMFEGVDATRLWIVHGAHERFPGAVCGQIT